MPLGPRPTWLGIVLQSRSSPIHFPVRARAYGARSSPVRHLRTATNRCFSLTLKFLSLFFSLPSPLKKKKVERKENCAPWNSSAWRAKTLQVPKGVVVPTLSDYLSQQHRWNTCAWHVQPPLGSSDTWKTSLFFFLNFRDSKGERENQFVVPLTYAFIACFLSVPRLEIKSTTLAYGDKALTDWTAQLGWRMSCSSSPQPSSPCTIQNHPQSPICALLHSSSFDTTLQ